VVVVLLAIALVAWLVLRDGDSETTISSEAEIVSTETLEGAAEGSDTPIYWAGPKDDAELELSRPSDDRTYVRYLTGEAEAGDPRPSFLTVGTYVYPGAVNALRKQSEEPGGELASAPGGATVYFNRERPESVYLAFPDEDIQIEVYHPDAERALKLVSSGQIVPVS
jgi:hypothetical protein